MRLDALADGLRLRANAHHQRHVGAVYVGVHQADLMAKARQRDRQIHRDRRFSDSAFA